MTPRKLHISFLLLFTAFLAVFFWFLNFNGELGHDAVYFFARLHAGQWHFARQGLSIFYFTPHFCGGVPQFANPQDMFYSLPQMLAIAGTDLWRASQLSILFAMILGYFGWYLFGRDILRFKTEWSHVFALIIIAHGFYLMHMIAGHLVFFTMPLIGLLLWLVLDRRKDSVRLIVIKAAVFGLVSAFIMYSGGYAVGLMAIVALIIFLLYEFVFNYSIERLNTFLVRLTSCGVSALLINASKLIAVWSYMRFVTREKAFEQFTEGSSSFLYMIKSYWAIPQVPKLFKSIGMPDRATHEYSLYLSPIVLIGLVLGIYLLWRKRKVIRSNLKKMILVAFVSLFFLIFFLQLAQGYGVLVSPLEELPIFKSLHVNVRFLYPLSFLIIAIGVYSLTNISNRKWLALLSGALTVFAFVVAYYPLMQADELPRTMPVETHRELVEEYDDFVDKDVTQMLSLQGGLEELIPIFSGGNHINCYESLFWGTDIFRNNPVSGGAPKVQADGMFNIYNPACLQYPEANGCKPGDRIRSDDGKNAELFLKGEKTGWKIPVWQRVGNSISFIVLIGTILVLIYGGISKTHRCLNRR